MAHAAGRKYCSFKVGYGFGTEKSDGIVSVPNELIDYGHVLVADLHPIDNICTSLFTLVKTQQACANTPKNGITTKMATRKVGIQ